MNPILFESFEKINQNVFNNEYALIVPRFSDFFGRYENSLHNEKELGRLVSSYYQCLRMFEIVVNYDSFLRINSTYQHLGSKEILFDSFLNDYFNKSLLSFFIILKKTELNKEYRDSHYFSIDDYNNYVTEITRQGKAKEYIKGVFKNSLAFLKEWEKELGVNILEEYRKKLSERDNFLYKTESGKTVLSYFLSINEYCSSLEWSVSLNAKDVINALSDLTNISANKLNSDFSKEVFFNQFLVNKESRKYLSLEDFLKHNFPENYIEALLSDCPKEFILNSMLELVPNSSIEREYFSYLNNDLLAIEKGIKNQKGFKVLLHGIAGTGKTEFSKIIAKTCDKKMYRLKMSSVMNSPEKSSLEFKISQLMSVAQIFSEDNFIFLFDECESLFENNNKFKEEINYTLEKINLPCIFIANEIKNFHTAYLRRFHYHLNVDLCDYNQKLKIISKYLSNSNDNYDNLLEEKANNRYQNDRKILEYIASQSSTNADLKDNLEFYKATKNFDFLRQKVENNKITKELIQLNTVEEATYNFIYPENNSFNFNEIIGYEHEKEMLLDLKHYLDNKDKYKELNIHVARGYILHGLPGTGKTSIIKALAKYCELPLINVTTGLIENNATGSLNIKKIFNIAKKNAPCIILLDEFEKMALNRKLEISNGTSQSLMNQLLMELDNIVINDLDIFVYATCNTIDYIDPAISRSGRLEKMIEIGLPNLSTREKMLSKLLNGTKMPKLKQLIPHTTGFSYVDLKSVVNNYKISLLKNKKNTSLQSLLLKEIHEFMLGKKGTGKLLKEEKKIVAYHETGHAFLAYLFDKKVGNISIIPKSGYLGLTLMIQDENKHIKTKEDIENEIMILMGGKASEELFLQQETSGSNDDFRRATNLVLNNLNLLARDKMGLFHNDMSEYNLKYSEDYKITVENTTKEILDKLFEKTKELLKNNEEEIKKMASTLIQKEEIAQREMETLLYSMKCIPNRTKGITS